MSPQEERKADFCIEIDFQRGTENPSRIFKAMTDLIETFQSMDTNLVRSIDSKIEPVAIIEDVEAGSLRAWLAYRLRAYDDKDIKNLNWKPIIGQYLVDAKYIILDYLEGRTEFSSRQEVEYLEKALLKSAQETDIIHFPAYSPVERQRLLADIQKLTVALSSLNEKDKAIYISDKEPKTMNAKFAIVPEKIEDLLTKETIESEIPMIIKVKKPDYLGESQWEFRHANSVIFAKFLDEKWLKEFQERKHDVRPGDSLRVQMKITVKHGFDGEVVGIHHHIVKVVEVIRFNPGEQASLLPQ